MNQSEIERLTQMVADIVTKQYAAARKSDSEFWGEARLALRSLNDHSQNVDKTLVEIRDQLKADRDEINSLRSWRAAITAGITVILVVAIPLISRAFNSLEQGINEVKSAISDHIKDTR